MVTTSKKKWEVSEEYEATRIEDIASELEVSPFFVKVCMQRGLDTAEKIKQFIQVDETWFHDPLQMHDMEKVVARIVTAIEASEKITVYGDYDADGMTSTAVLVETLESLGANVEYFLPSRFVEGYGPNIEAFERIINEGTSLIITVDNGVAGHDAIDRAKELGVDVIVTDHHELPSELPEAYAIIHPAHPEGTYPFKDLAGVGVALKLVQALLGDLPAELLELAAIGTVADLVPLVDENRAIVFYGLKMIQHTERVGLLQLLNLIGVSPSEVNEETIGFQISPRLNAVGRLGEASPCVELLLTYDMERASEIAQFVDKINEERKLIVEHMVEDVANEMVHKSDQEVIVLANENWHQGVLGIVASRVVERTNKPTLLFTINPETNIATGSARSIEGFNMFTAFQKNSDLFIKSGGHSMAAGMSAEVEKLSDIQERMNTLFKEAEDIELVQRIDSYVSLEDITVDSIREVEKLRPFGTANVKPLVAAKDVQVMQKRSVGATGDHLKLLVGKDNDQLDIISFQNGYMSGLLSEQQQISVAGYLEINEWNGTTKPQMQMIDVDIPGPLLVDNRKNRLVEKDFSVEYVEYIFYEKETYEKWRTFIPASSKAIFIQSDQEAEKYEAQSEMVIVDCPKSIKQFKATISNNELYRIRTYFYKENHLYLSGLPTRDDFAKVYKFVATHQEIDLINHGHLFVQKLKLDKNRIYLIVEVFLEAKFVIINSGVLQIVKHPEKKELQSTETYINANAEFQAEELFIFSSFNEVLGEFIDK